MTKPVEQSNTQPEKDGSGHFGAQVHAFGKDSLPPQHIDYHALAVEASKPHFHRESIVNFVLTAFKRN